MEIETFTKWLRAASRVHFPKSSELKVLSRDVNERQPQQTINHSRWRKGGRHLSRRCIILKYLAIYLWKTFLKQGLFASTGEALLRPMPCGIDSFKNGTWKKLGSRLNRVTPKLLKVLSKQFSTYGIQMHVNSLEGKNGTPYPSINSGSTSIC